MPFLQTAFNMLFYYYYLACSSKMMTCTIHTCDINKSGRDLTKCLNLKQRIILEYRNNSLFLGSDLLISLQDILRLRQLSGHCDNPWLLTAYFIEKKIDLKNIVKCFLNNNRESKPYRKKRSLIS